MADECPQPRRSAQQQGWRTGKLCRGQAGEPVHWPAGGRSSRAFRMEDAALGPRSTWWSTYAAGSTRRAGLQHGCCGVVQRTTMPPDTEACRGSWDPSGASLDCRSIAKSQASHPSLWLFVTRQHARPVVASVGRVWDMARQTCKAAGVVSLGSCFGCLACCAEWTKKKAGTYQQTEAPKAGIENRESKTEAGDAGSNRRSETSKNAVEVVENKHGHGQRHVRGSGSGRIEDRGSASPWSFSPFDF